MSLKLDNLIDLLDYLSPNEYRTVNDLAKKLGVDRRTVFRYIDEIELAFGNFPIIERNREGCRLCKNDFLEVMQARDDYAGLAAIMASPLGSLVEPKYGIPQRLTKTVKEMVEVRSALGQKLLRAIFEAMRTGNFLEIEYNAKGQARTHLCVLVKFFMSSGIPYVVSYDEGYGHLICLGADKIGRAAKSRKTLPAETLAELRGYVNSAWGMMIQHKERKRVEVEFEAGPAVAPYFEKAPLHPSQKRSERDGKIFFALLVHNESEFVRFLLRFGRAVRIASPESTIGELKSFLGFMADFYDEGGSIEA